MTRVLVLQMCRLGDILQTTPMLRGIRREHPDAEITLVLHDVFRDVPVPAHLYDRLVIFPYGRLAQTMSAARHEWRREVERLRDWVRELGETPFDLVLNLTHSDLAGLLTSMIPARAISGGLVAPDRTRVVRGPWMTYFWASQSARAQGAFNLVDVHNYAAGVASDGLPLEMAVPDRAHAKMGEWLSARGLGERRIVAVQMGASEERKRWPAEQVAEALNRVPASLADVVMVGAADERHLVERAQSRLTRPVHVALGETSITELAALLKRSALLLTNDTGTMHVATAMGTRIVDLSTGNVFVHETAPYGEGHFVLEPRMACFPCTAGSTCHHFQCREAFTPDDVAALVRHALGAGDVPRPSGATVLQGRFVGGGRIQYRALWPAEPAVAERRRQAGAIMWAESLAAPAHPDAARDVDPGADLAGWHDRPEVLDALARLRGHAQQLARGAERLACAPPADQARWSSKMDDEMRQMQLVSQLEPVCHPLVAYLKVTLDSTTTTDVVGLADVYRREALATAARAERLGGLLAGEGDARRIA